MPDIQNKRNTVKKQDEEGGIGGNWGGADRASSVWGGSPKERQRNGLQRNGAGEKLGLRATLVSGG